MFGSDFPIASCMGRHAEMTCMAFVGVCSQSSASDNLWNSASLPSSGGNGRHTSPETAASRALPSLENGDKTDVPHHQDEVPVKLKQRSQSSGTRIQ